MRAEPSCGGAELETLVVDASMFEASVMEGGDGVAFQSMKLPQLKAELAARNAVRTGIIQGEAATPPPRLTRAGSDCASARGRCGADAARQKACR